MYMLMCEWLMCVFVDVVIDWCVLFVGVFVCLFVVVIMNFGVGGVLFGG